MMRKVSIYVEDSDIEYIRRRGYSISGFVRSRIQDEKKKEIQK